MISPKIDPRLVLTYSIYLKPLHSLAHFCLHWDNDRLPERDNEYQQMGQQQEQEQKRGQRAISLLKNLFVCMEL